jgi:hypothetical protein
VKAGDFAGAMTTSRSLGDWRLEVHTDVACRLLEDRRFDDAYRFVRSLPGRDRDWALAHIAAQLSHPPFSPRRQHIDAVDTTALTRRGLEITREIHAPNARIDALLSIAYTQVRRNDTSGAVESLRAANAILPTVRDTDYVTSRRMMIASALGRAGRIDEALESLRPLPYRDRVAGAWSMRGWPRRSDPRVRTELLSMASWLSRVIDPAERAEYASGIAEALKEAGDSAAADSLGRIYRRDTAPTVTPPERPTDDADSLAAAREVPRAIGLIEDITDSLRVGLRARAFLSIVNSASAAGRDTVRLILARAFADARTVTTTDPFRDDLLADIAREQLVRGFHDDGVATVNAIRTVDRAVWPLTEIGPEPGESLGMRGRRRIIARVANSDVQASASAKMIEPGLAGSPSADDLAWATAFADSLPASRARDRAQLAIARRDLARKDTVAARARLIPLLATYTVDRVPELYEHDRVDQVPVSLIRVGGEDEAMRWARSLTEPADRAGALLMIAHAFLVRSQTSTLMWVSNGPDSCREEF